MLYYYSFTFWPYFSSTGTVFLLEYHLMGMGIGIGRGMLTPILLPWHSSYLQYYVNVHIGRIFNVTLSHHKVYEHVKVPIIHVSTCTIVRNVMQLIKVSWVWTFTQELNMKVLYIFVTSASSKHHLKQHKETKHQGVIHLYNQCGYQSTQKDKLN